MNLLPSLAVKVPEKVSAALLRDDDWLLQEKVDGKRILVYCDPGGWLHFSNKAGDPTTLPKDARLPSLPPGTLVDCEYLYADKTLCALDLVEWRGESWREMPAVDRYIQLLACYEDIGVRIVRCALDPLAKDVLIHELHATHAEGIVLKHKQRPYTPGKLTSNPALIKVPWRKRMDVVLSKPTTGTKRHFMIWAYQDGLPKQIGEIAAASWWDHLIPGGAQVFEIEYLYASKSGRLVQPQIVRPRNDKRPTECLVSQMQIGGRHAS